MARDSNINIMHFGPNQSMERKKLWIFGDSYSDPTSSYMSHFEPWVSRIAGIYDVTNLSMCGTGPDFSLRELIDLIRDNDAELDETSVIFFISSIYRFNFKFLHASDQVLAPYVADGYPGQRNEEMVAQMERYSRFRPFVQDYLEQYVWHSSFNKTELLKIVGSLKLLSHRFEKMMVWPIFDDQKLVDIQDDGRFFYVKHSLSRIEGVGGGFSRDSRPNHLSQDNHEVMLRQLCGWMDHGIPIDVSLFSNPNV